MRSGLIKFRRGHALLGRPDFLAPQDITWHEDNWDNPESKFLAFSLHDRRAHMQPPPALAPTFSSKAADRWTMLHCVPLQLEASAHGLSLHWSSKP
jgi:hypothetical protein